LLFPILPRDARYHPDIFKIETARNCSKLLALTRSRCFVSANAFASNQAVCHRTSLPANTKPSQADGASSPNIGRRKTAITGALTQKMLLNHRRTRGQDPLSQAVFKFDYKNLTIPQVQLLPSRDACTLPIEQMVIAPCQQPDFTGAGGSNTTIAAILPTFSAPTHEIDHISDN
jgi:hypothetical protein